MSCRISKLLVLVELVGTESLCLAVAIAEPAFCSSVTSVKLLPPKGHISSEITAETGCGTRRAPWVMDAMSGQIINITLLNFGFEDVGTAHQDWVFGSGACTR